MQVKGATSIRTEQRWTKEDDEYLRKNYYDEEVKVMTKYLGRTYRALRDRARFLGVTRKSLKMTPNEFLERFHKIFSKEEYRIVGKYKSTHEHIKYYHEGCQSYNKSTPASLLQGHGCICNKTNSNRVSGEEFLRRVQTQGKGEYKVTSKKK